MGCGVNCTRGEIFFTKNGRHLGVAFKRVPSTAKYFPCVAVRHSMLCLCALCICTCLCVFAEHFFLHSGACFLCISLYFAVSIGLTFCLSVCMRTYMHALNVCAMQTCTTIAMLPLTCHIVCTTQVHYIYNFQSFIPIPNSRVFIFIII